MKKLILLFTAIILSTGFLSAQTTLENVRNLKNAHNSGTIIQNNKLVGYYVFYTKEKVDKENNVYEVALFDDNYNRAGSFEIIRSKKSVLTEMVYNGAAFILQFYDKKIGLEYLTYSLDGKISGNFVIAEENICTAELRRLTESIETGTENTSLFPLNKDGFIRHSIIKPYKYGYEIVAYDNSLKELWTFGSDPDADSVQTSEIIDISENILTAVVHKKKDNDSWNSKVYCLILDTKTGREIKQFELGSQEVGQKTLLKSFIDEKLNQIIVVGEYYEPGEEHSSHDSEGLFVMGLDMSGSVQYSDQFSWDENMLGFIKDNLSKEELKQFKKSSIYFHDVVIGKNGHISLIGEQFQKGSSSSSDNKQASNSGDLSDILLKSMIIIELNENLTIADFDIFPKTNRFADVPNRLSNDAAIGRYLKAKGEFGYCFTTQDEETNEFNVIYIDSRRWEMGDGKLTVNDKMIGQISVREGEKINSKIPINPESWYFWIQAAKPGYIAVAEYYRKEKKIVFRLEHLDY